MDKDKNKVKSLLRGSGYKCSHCGAEADSAICCRTGANHYMFEWCGGGFNETHADSAEEAYEKVLAQREASGGSSLKPLRGSFRLFDSKEYDRLLSHWD